MNYIKYTGWLWLVFLYAGNGIAQPLLPKMQAVEITLENNFDIRMTRNDIERARNNADILNSGYLPAVSAKAGMNYTLRNTHSELQDGSSNNITGADTYLYSSSIGLNYTLFDGMGRKYNFDKLKESYGLSELQLRQTIEITVLKLFSVYYEVARLSQNKINQAETVSISRNRLLRSGYGYEYGQNTQLDVLNAEVDFNNDSIAYLNISQELDNTKRDLNVLLGRDVNEIFVVDTAIVYQKGLTLEMLREDALKNNVSVLQSESMLLNSKYDLGISKSGYVPKVYLNAGYNWDKSNFDQTNTMKYRTLIGPVAGVNLSWNVFDGGYTRTRVQNAKISIENQKIGVDQTKQYLERDLNNAWGFYQNALFVLEAEKKNLDTNQRNFERTMDQNKLGQITNIVFRQAQLNLLRAKLNYNKAKYLAKTAELALLKLSGDLMFAQF